jgi:hypothetical protein
MSDGPIDVEVSGGDNQVAAPNTMVRNLVVKVTRGGAPAAGVKIVFLVSAGGGTIGKQESDLRRTFETSTGSDGTATLPLWRLGDREPQKVVARAGDPVEDIVTFAASFPPSIRPLNEDTHQQGPAREPLKLPLYVVVTRGSTPAATVKVTFEVKQGGGKLSQDLVAEVQRLDVRSDERGLASAQYWLIGERGPQLVEAYLTDYPGTKVPFTAEVVSG